MDDLHFVEGFFICIFSKYPYLDVVGDGVVQLFGELFMCRRDRKGPESACCH